MSRVDWDKVANADPIRVSKRTYAIINALQLEHVETRLLGAAVHFKLLTEVTGANFQDVMTAADNIMASPEGQSRRPEFLAAKAYMEHETK